MLLAELPVLRATSATSHYCVEALATSDTETSSSGERLLWEVLENILPIPDECARF
jgi:hypothetical protein